MKYLIQRHEESDMESILENTDGVVWACAYRGRRKQKYETVSGSKGEFI